MRDRDDSARIADCNADVGLELLSKRLDDASAEAWCRAGLIRGMPTPLSLTASVQLAPWDWEPTTITPLRLPGNACFRALITNSVTMRPMLIEVSAPTVLSSKSSSMASCFVTDHGRPKAEAQAFKQVSFIESDAAALDLPTQGVDAFFSRFGVMALSDHAKAFSNFHRMLKPGGRIAFVCWRSLAENELDLLPLQAAGLEHLADPTPFSLEDASYIHATLEGAGFKNVNVSAYDEAVTSGDVDAMTALLMKVGPLGKIIRENPALQAAAEPRVRVALGALGDPRCVALSAATWIVSGRA